jgi:hypothetical protein
MAPKPTAASAIVTGRCADGGAQSAARTTPNTSSASTAYSHPHRGRGVVFDGYGMSHIAERLDTSVTPHRIKTASRNRPPP